MIGTTSKLISRSALAKAEEAKTQIMQQQQNKSSEELQIVQNETKRLQAEIVALQEELKQAKASKISGINTQYFLIAHQMRSGDPKWMCYKRRNSDYNKKLNR